MIIKKKENKIVEAKKMNKEDKEKIVKDKLLAVEFLNHKRHNDFRRQRRNSAFGGDRKDVIKAFPNPKMLKNEE